MHIEVFNLILSGYMFYYMLKRLMLRECKFCSYNIKIVCKLMLYIFFPRTIELLMKKKMLSMNAPCFLKVVEPYPFLNSCCLFFVRKSYITHTTVPDLRGYLLRAYDTWFKKNKILSMTEYKLKYIFIPMKFKYIYYSTHNSKLN